MGRNRRDRKRIKRELEREKQALVPPFPKEEEGNTMMILSDEFKQRMIQYQLIIADRYRRHLMLEYIRGLR